MRVNKNKNKKIIFILKSNVPSNCYFNIIMMVMCIVCRAGGGVKLIEIFDIHGLRSQLDYTERGAVTVAGAHRCLSVLLMLPRVGVDEVDALYRV